jgi:hypothetical protein
MLWRKRGRIAAVSRTRASPLAPLVAAILLFSISGARHQGAPTKTAQPVSTQTAGTARGVSIVQNEGSPELRVDGVPFFVHSGAFFYDRVPQDLWERVLDRYRTLGINTIEIYIPWNWHEPREGEFDFDGHTNPRRDLRRLLRLINEKGFKLIARPGPQILNEWRHGGYPGWLLERPEYHMDLVDRLEGRYPPFSYLNTRDAEAAAKELLENPTHMSYTRKWLEAVAHELAPYGSSRTVPPQPPAATPPEASGPVLFVQLEDDLAIGRMNTIGPIFWRYLDALRQMLEASRLTTAVFINPTDMRVSAAGSALARPMGVMGQWYMSPREEGESRISQLTVEDVSDIEFYVEELKTQPAFPPIFIEYQAGWYCPGDDDRPLASPPENTLLSSRLAIGHGLHGLNYFPLQDTYTPAGYSAPWENRSYRWDAAIDPNGNYGPRARAVARNGQMLRQWGQWLAGSHKRADFGIIYPVGAYRQELLNALDILHVSSIVLRLERVAQLARLSGELVDPQYQPVEELLRHAILLLPAPDPSDPKFELSETAQRALVEYVRHGGTLIYFPSQPPGRILQELWATPPSPGPSTFSAISRRWSFGTGQVIESTKDFYSWAALDKGFAENHGQQEAGWATQVLEGFLNAAGVHAVVKRGNGKGSPDLIVTELISNEGTRLLGTRSGGTGLLSVTNIGDVPVDEAIEVLAPGTSARTLGNSYLPLHVVVPPKESLLLPLLQPLCSPDIPPQSCRDWVVSAGAELLHAGRKRNTLELTFYTPTRATTRIKLAARPSHATLEETKPEAKWNVDRRELELELRRGASPNFLRIMNIALPYTPQIAEEQVLHNRSRRNFEYTVADAVRLPVGEGASLWPDPPLLALDASHPAKLILQVINPNPEQYRDFNFRVEGQLHGTAGLRVPANGTAFVTVKLKTAGREADLSGIQPASDGLVHGTLEIHSGNERVDSPILFALVRPGAVSRYQFDFDRDGAMEWVLENSALRLIVSPESGGRAMAFVNKDPNANLITSVGALRDNFSYAANPTGMPAERARGRYGLFNRPYRAEWVEEQGIPALRISYDAPDILPGGAGIQKTIRLETTNTLQANYRVQLFKTSSTVAAANPPQAFVAVNSVPAMVRADRSTRFCWMSSDSGVHCEAFSPDRAAVELPKGSHRLEVRTPGRPGLALEWGCTKPPAQPCGQMRIEMMRFSALLKLQFPPLTPGGGGGEYSIRFSVLPAEEESAQ